MQLIPICVDCEQREVDAPALYPQIYRVLAEGDAELVQGLGQIACPTLVMTGEDYPATCPPWHGPWRG